MKLAKRKNSEIRSFFIAFLGTSLISEQKTILNKDVKTSIQPQNDSGKERPNPENNLARNFTTLLPNLASKSSGKKRWEDLPTLPPNKSIFDEPDQTKVNNDSSKQNGKSHSTDYDGTFMSNGDIFNTISFSCFYVHIDSMK